ncbi:DUF4350 domain-containing protein [Bacillus alkalisoli]|uniref:DUF4350 domain-containing protein n=1 Tax=Bacillus alkalisoli TaxID=2011008 RepID=UPI000C2371DE|nr:DUF4350 domain-containing protein [Bacillus alkalisoli]
MQKRILKQSWLWLLLLLLLFLFISFMTSPTSREQYPPYVSNSPSPTGVKAIYTYLEKEFEVTTWNHSPELLPTSAGNLLIMVEPFFMPSSEEFVKYEQFLANGNSILLLQNNPKDMFDLSTKIIPGDMSEEMFTTVTDNDGKEFMADIYSFVRLMPANTDKVLLNDQVGVIAIKRHVGNGTLIIANTPQWMTNKLILKDDHLPLLLSLFNELTFDKVLFDEYIHQSKGFMNYVRAYPLWFTFLLIQGILLTSFILWKRGKRFGPILVAREESVRFSDESIKALSAWNLQGRSYHESLHVQVEYVKLLLQEKWGIPFSKSWKDTEDQLERKCKRMTKEEQRNFINGMEKVLDDTHLSKKDYLSWSKRIDNLRKEVEGE